MGPLAFVPLLLLGTCAAQGPSVGTTYCGKVESIVKLSVKVDDAAHVDIDGKILGLPKNCNNEAYNYDATSHALTLTGISSPSDCVAETFKKFKQDPSSLKLTWDEASKAIHLSIAGKEADLTPANCKSSDAELFADFERAFGRVYASAEERTRRFAIFAENLVQIEHMRMADPSAQYSHLTPLADWTVEEFAARNTLQPQLFSESSAVHSPLLNISDLPDSFDWREKGAVNPIKNQAQCGSCWAFATVANVEGVNFLKTKQLLSLSEQELVDCDKTTGDQGCQGGLPSNAYKDMIQNKIGLELESDYPYVAKDGTCKASQAKENVFISSWTAVSTDEDQIAAALMKYGPLAIGINAGPMQFYSGGVAKPSKILCNPQKLDHGVAIVGFGVDSGTKYWIIRNSWGTTWGEKGYYRIIRGTGACGLNTMVTTAQMNGTVASTPTQFII